jgi:flagellar biosynthesis/type III secretory pathway M-ring protein FliF/YscJ
MTKIWAWLKKNWKWLILPLWVLSVVLVWIFRGGDKTLFPVTGTTDDDADKVDEAHQKASAEFRARLDELAKKAEERLKTASEEQIKEYETIKDKPLDEVAAWIDNLS